MEGIITKYRYEQIEFVNRFLDDELLNSIVEETNLYSTKKNPNKQLNVKTQEIRNFIRIVYKLPATQRINNNLHFNNNDTIPPDNIDNNFKIRPLLSSLLTKFQSTPID